MKLDLGVILCLGALLWVVHARLMASPLWQFVLLIAYGLGGMLWVIVRARRVLRSQQAQTARTRGAIHGKE